MKQFTVINESFVCQNCQHPNPPHKNSCRNHCTQCLFSLHLDKNSPGDRQSTCHGLMQPVKVEQDGKKGWMIVHKCRKCKKTIRNKAADDDNFDVIIQLTNTLSPPRL